jgi:hypothetical protein
MNFEGSICGQENAAVSLFDRRECQKTKFKRNGMGREWERQSEGTLATTSVRENVLKFLTKAERHLFSIIPIKTRD